MKASISYLKDSGVFQLLKAFCYHERCSCSKFPLILGEITEILFIWSSIFTWQGKDWIGKTDKKTKILKQKNIEQKGINGQSGTVKPATVTNQGNS